MKKLTLKKTRWSRIMHTLLVLTVIAGFICTAASFGQAVTTSSNVVSRVVNHNEMIGFVRIGFVSLGITGMALLMFAFSTSVRSSSERRRNAILRTEVESCRKDINQLKKKESKSKKT